MAVSLKHTFQSAKADGPDNTIVQPSDWNDEHVLTLAAGNVLGRASSAGNGAAQELPLAVATDGTTVISTNSSTAALRITQTGTGNALVVEDSTNPDSTPFVVDQAGQVGIGVASPQALLHVGADASVTVRLQRNTNDSSAAPISYVKQRGTAAVPVSVNSGDALGSLLYNGFNGTSIVLGARIDAAADGIPTSTDMPGRLVFSTTASGASTPTERMRIDNGGRVAIGATTAASQSFRVTKNITGDTLAYGIVSNGAVQTDVTNTAYYNYSISSTAASASIAGIQHYSANQGTFGAGSTVTSQYGFIANSPLTGATNNYGFFGNIASGTGRWNFYAAGTADNYFGGNVGIGKSAPVNKLDVTGSFGRGAPVIKTGNFTLASTENWVIVNNASANTTVTFPAASSWTGREVMFKNLSSTYTVISASSNVVPLDSASAGTAILPAGAGKWVTLVSDGTNWVAMAGELGAYGI